ncbi:MAG: nicotinamide-nucleotide amidohydrolase family protein [Dehalococcoidia bacterium]
MKKSEEQIAILVRAYRDKAGKCLTIGTVESATGGRVADKITNVAGSSDYYKGSIVSYSNDLKVDAAGVKPDTLKLHGAVSPETAGEMAEGGRKALDVDICLSTTGIAGPGGATQEKPAGLFYISVATPDEISVEKFVFKGNRIEIKRSAARKALGLLENRLQGYLDRLSSIPLEEKHVVTCFLEQRQLILILRRSNKVGTYQRTWAGVSGYIETDPLDQAYSEIREETGLFKNNIRLVKEGKTVEVVDEKLHRKWIVHPFLFHVLDPDKILIDWEHTECKWIKPGDLSGYTTVPGLDRALRSVMHK